MIPTACGYEWSRQGNGAPAVVLAHGSRSWLIRGGTNSGARGGWLSRAGPDQRGYGGSSRPEAVEAYDIRELTTDIVGLLDDVGAERACGWVMTGGARWHGCGAAASDRVAAVVGLSVPRCRAPRCAHPGAAQALRRQVLLHAVFPGAGGRRRRVGRRPGQDDSPNDGRLRGSSDPAPGCGWPAGPEGFVERLPEPDGLPDWISGDELDHYIAEFTRTGFTGGLNWYRNLDRNWEIMATR
ncbi:alpha/beta hydrolase family protein [Mycobacterium xenopi 3993]|nr:alpha/beta hydrolase family protein [Mycobacterium xenopi 3993]